MAQKPLVDKKEKDRVLYLEKVIAVQDAYMNEKPEGVTVKYFYETKIRGRFYISQSTFYAYLRLNAKRELRIIQEKLKKQEECAQLV